MDLDWIDVQEILPVLHSTLVHLLKRPVTLCYELWQQPLAEPEIERVPVSSCMFSSIGFDAERRTLQVEYNNGSLYCIEDVPAQTYGALMKAENLDQYYRDNISNCHRMKQIGKLTPIG